MFNLKKNKISAVIAAFLGLSKKEQVDLRISEEKFSAAFRACPDLMSITRLSDGEILDVNEGYTRLLGYTRSESIGKTTNKISIWVDPADRVKFISTLKKFGEINDFEATLRRKDGTFVDVIDSARTFNFQGEKCVLSVVHDNSSRKQAEKEHLLNLKFMESMDRVNRALQGTNNLEQMLSDVLDVVLSVFDCDRAWLVYPSNPGTISYSVPMERTKPEYPGAFIQGVELLVDPDSARLFQLAKTSSEPLVIDEKSEPPLPALIMKRFQVKSQIVTNLYPKGDKSYMFGLHQCSHQRVWTAEEKRLFKEISRRLSDGLTSLLIYRNLKKSEGDYRRLVETANEGIWVIDKDHKTTFVNQRMLDMFGYTEKEMLEKKADDLVIPEELESHKNEMQKRAKGGTSSYERRFIRKDGGVIWTHLSGTPLYDDKKQFKGSFGMLTDITDKKMAEIEIAQNNRALRMVSDINQALIRITDETTLLNSACRISVEVGGYLMAWVGFTQQDKLKTVQSAASFGVARSYVDTADVHWADDKRGRGPTGTAIRIGQTQVCRDISKDPKMIPWRQAALGWGFKSSIALPLTSEGKTFGAITIYSGNVDAFSKEEVKILEELASDLAFGIINQRNHVKQQLMAEDIKKNEERLLEAQRIGHFGNWDWDIATDKITWSDEYYSIFGLDPKKSPPGYEEHLKIYTPESAQRLDAAVKLNMKSGEPYELDLEIAKPKSSCHWITARSETIFDANGKIVGLRGTAQDITERKAAERLMTEFVSLASHQLRTPLSGSKWLLELLLRDPEHTLTADQQDLIQGIVASNERTIALVGDLLDVSHIDTGQKFKLIPKPTDIISLISIAVAEKKQQAEKKRIVIQLEKKPSQKIILNVDKDKILQVFENLIDNAVKYSNPNTKITIGAKLNTDQVTFYIQDHGIGVPIANQDKIFHRFFRADNAARMDNTGTGLGLYIAKGIIEYHQGKIWFESVEGKGSTFYFSLPINLKQNKPDVKKINK